MKKIGGRFLLLSAVMMALVSCGIDGKNPLPGYEETVGDTFAAKVIQKLDGTYIPSTYDVKGSINFYGMANEDGKFETSVDTVAKGTPKAFNDSPSEFSKSNSSFYLRLPLHLTTANWNSSSIDTQGLTLATKYRLEAAFIRKDGIDKVYYYLNSDGGFTIRSFAANKILKMYRPVDMEGHGKWNCSATYDKYGLLIEESFATINAHSDPDSESIYGGAKYTYNA